MAVIPRNKLFDREYFIRRADIFSGDGSRRFLPPRDRGKRGTSMPPAARASTRCQLTGSVVIKWVRRVDTVSLSCRLAISSTLGKLLSSARIFRRVVEYRERVKLKILFNLYLPSCDKSEIEGKFMARSLFFIFLILLLLRKSGNLYRMEISFIFLFRTSKWKFRFRNILLAIWTIRSLGVSRSRRMGNLGESKFLRNVRLLNSKYIWSVWKWDRKRVIFIKINISQMLYCFNSVIL